MQLIIEYFRENRKKVLLLGILVTVLIGFMIFTNNKEDENKIYESDDYIYTKESYNHDSGLVSVLPYINIKSEEIKEINIQLIKKYYEIVTIDKQMMVYEYYKNDNVLSLVVSTYYQEAPDVPNEMFFYNVDLKKGSLISNEELIDMFGVTDNEVSDLIRNALNEYYNYEIEKGYISNSCDFDCYLSSTDSLPILDDCNYYVKDNGLYVYKSLLLDSDFYYDDASKFDLFNFKIK